MFFSSLRAKLIFILILLGGVPLLVVGAISYHSAANALMVQTKAAAGQCGPKNR